MVPEESRAEGTIGVKLYMKYLRSGASVAALLLVILMNLTAQVNRKHRRRRSLLSKCEETFKRLLLFTSQAAYVMQDWWLAYW